eukprot:gnl/TRDRNA2_/TRDRNA2_38419_c0_seq1.p1 gnl/TRDRNA2_/TRDRNA2_38419_c0~~gnl/TRDRNA2_/TRDRNA2_38419_c0_seq1.p1  ORF type:complete len:268 (-),score=77.66 gnl/TRDRNA2_/TRDRNA2_38419_c0_seq1:75-878(-)
MALRALAIGFLLVLASAVANDLKHSAAATKVHDSKHKTISMQSRCESTCERRNMCAGSLDENECSQLCQANCQCMARSRRMLNKPKHCTLSMLAKGRSRLIQIRKKAKDAKKKKRTGLSMVQTKAAQPFEESDPFRGFIPLSEAFEEKSSKWNGNSEKPRKPRMLNRRPSHNGETKRTLSLLHERHNAKLRLRHGAKKAKHGRRHLRQLVHRAKPTKEVKQVAKVENKTASKVEAKGKTETKAAKKEDKKPEAKKPVKAAEAAHKKK